MKDSVCITIQVSGNADSAFIEWETNVRDVFPVPYNGTRKYKYGIIPNSCYCPNGDCSVIISVGAWQNCSGPKIVNLVLVPITLISSPNAQFTITPNDTICVGQQACFNLVCNCYSSGTTFNWDFGNSLGTSTLANPCYTYPIPPSLPVGYNVTLSATNVCGVATHSDSIHIRLSTVNVISNLPDTCAPVSFIPKVTSSNVNTFFWTLTPNNPGNSISNPNNDTTSISIIVPGTYTLTLAGGGPCCAFSLPNDCSWDTIFTIHPGPQLNHSSINDTCVLSVTSFNSAQYFSNFGGNNSISWTVTENGNVISNYNGFSPPVFPIDSGTYIISVAYTNICGTDSVRDTFQVYNPATLQLPPSDTLCANISSIVLNATPPGGTWTWYSVSGNGILTNSIFYTNSTTDTIVHFVYHYGTGLCAVSDTIFYYIPGANVDAGSDISICSNVVSIPLPSGNPVGGAWSNSPAISGNNYLPGNALNNPDTLLYTVSTFGGCLVSDTLLISLSSLAINSPTIPDTVCVGQTVVFNSNAANVNDTITWYFGDASLAANGLNTTYAYSSAQTFIISIIIQNYGCIDSTHATIVVMPGISPQFSTSGSGCSPLALQLNNQSPDSNTSNFQWWVIEIPTNDTVFYFSGINPPLTTIAQGITDTANFIIVMQDSGRCGNQVILDTITAYPQPQSIFGPTCLSCCQYDTICFVNSTIGNPTSYKWYINGLLASNNPGFPCQPFNSPGTYNIALVAFNGCGSDSLLQLINIYPSNVIAGFNISPLITHCRPLLVQFNSFSSPANSVNQFDFGDGNFLTGDTVIHVYDTTGTFTITLIADGPCGLDTATATITIDDQPQVSFIATNLLCEGTAVHFQNTTIDSLAAVTWHFGDGDSSWLTNPSHLYVSPPNNYTVSLIGIALNTGCKDTATANITLLNSPHSTFTFSANSVCEGDTVYFNSPSLATNFSWSFGDSTFSSNNPAYHVYKDSGLYPVQLTVTAANGCSDDSVFNYIVVNNMPIPDFTYSQNQLCKTPALIHFTNQSTDAVSYNWYYTSFGDSSQLVNPDYSVPYSVTFPVTLIAETAFCRDSITKPVTAYASTSVNVLADNLFGCPPLEVQFTDSTENVNSLLYSFGNGITSNLTNPTYTYNSAGVFNVILSASYDSICFDSASIVITVFEEPIADFSIKDTLINNMVFQKFYNLSVCPDSCSYKWDFDDNTYSTLENPLHQYFSNAVRCITLIVTNKEGCIGKKTICYDVKLPGALAIPNALSPSLIHDERGYFAPKGYNIETLEIEIVSPFGERVWYSLNDLDENGMPTEKCRWDGNDYKTGKPLPQGGYVWRVIKATFKNKQEWEGMKYNESEEPKKAGSVILIR